MDYQCPECSEVMSLSEDKQSHTCTKCDVSLTLDEATVKFEAGDLVGLIEESKIDHDEKTIVASIDEDINALCEGEDLSEAFQEKAKVIFESAVATRVKVEVASLEEETTTRITKELSEQVDGYLGAVVSKWLEENKLAIESGLKSEMDESFMSGMAELFKEHYVTIPEGKEDLVEALATRVEDLEGKLDESIDSGVASAKELTEAEKALKVLVLSEGLADTQKEKLLSLAEGIEADTTEAFGEKLEVLKESYFKAKDSDDSLNEVKRVEDLDEGKTLTAREVSLQMLKNKE